MTIEAAPAADATLRAILADVLALSPERSLAITPSTPLFGAMPELDSMAVAGLLTEMEERLGFVIDDDDVDGAIFETYGALLAFTRAKMRV